MRNIKGCGKLWARIARFVLVSGIAAFGGSTWAQGWQLATNLTLKADLTLKETFDSNVYLQDHEPSPTVANAVRPFQESFVTSVTPKIGFEFKPSSGFNMSGFYAPEVVTFHDETSESHVAHRAGLIFNGVVGVVTVGVAGVRKVATGESGLVSTPSLALTRQK